ncbi:MAG: transaldolase [Gemmatimonadota bacterium]|nr:transaldolase [Gemmatimonadota bacterium]
MANPLVELRKCGQSPWYDNIERSLITSGKLQEMIDKDNLMGITSNPAIFEKAITGSADYDEAIEKMAHENLTALEIYESLAVEDIQMAADVLQQVYRRSDGKDGFVSLEVSPLLADDTEGTIAEAKRLWAEVDRANVMIKVPATTAGIPAVQRLIGEGMNVNVTLMFSQSVYEAVAEAYIAGLETLADKNDDLGRVNSVASFFISRIDTLVDSKLDEKLETAEHPRERAKLQSLKGRVAIANAKLTYQTYKSIIASERWQKLAAKGANTQRLLWASTSTKNPEYSDVMYVEELIGADTVNTLPQATMDAFRDHGRTQPTIEGDVSLARDTMSLLEAGGVSMNEITEQLVKDGVRLFADPFEKLLAAIEKKQQPAG